MFRREKTMFRNRFVVPTAWLAGLAVLTLALVSFTFAQQPPPTTAAPKPAAAKPKPAAGVTPAQVKSMIKAGLSEDLIANQIKKQNKPTDLTTDQMIDLKSAGASDRIIALLLDPSNDPGANAAAAKPAAAPDPTPAPPPPPAPTPAPDPPPSAVVDPGPRSTAGSSAAPVAGKKRLAVEEFDYSAVKSSVQAVFNTQVDIGKGIRAMLVKRLDGSGTGKFTIVERAKVNDILKEQDFGASNRVKQGSNARIGRIKGADALLMGDIVIFGRDDKSKGAGGGAALPGVLGGLRNVHKDDKAVVAIDFRLVDSETSEVIATGEARGESERKSNNWAALAIKPGTAGAGGGVDMTSSNFAETIVGEATMDCVNKLAEQLNLKASSLQSKQVEVETRVADASGSSVILAAGGNDGVAVGDRFEIGRIVRQVLDPTTKEVLDVVTQKLGELVITSVRDRTATGNYTGQPAKVNDYAKKIM
jgi:curli biogenesis system outer membrane secretion channel CsgG